MIPTLPSINDAIANGTALFELALLFSEWVDPKDPTKTTWGFFWIFADALMWEVPNDATWGFWKGTPVEQPLPRRPFGGVAIGDRKRLIRLPCTGREAQAGVDAIQLSQADLLAFDGADMTSPDAGDEKVPCLLPTAELYDLAYLRADVRIPPQHLPITSLTPNTLSYAEKVAAAFDAARVKTPPSSGQVKLLGTPGKIWAIADRMDTWVCCASFKQWVFACINHGFHHKITWDTKGKPTAHMLQKSGGCHDWNHTDYSQIFSAVAGWCWVKGPNEADATWKRTEAVYRDEDLCNLVRDTTPGRAKPAPATRYHGTPKTAKPKIPCPAK